MSKQWPEGRLYKGDTVQIVEPASKIRFATPRPCVGKTGVIRELLTQNRRSQVMYLLALEISDQIMTREHVIECTKELNEKNEEWKPVQEMVGWDRVLVKVCHVIPQQFADLYNLMLSNPNLRNSVLTQAETRSADVPPIQEDTLRSMSPEIINPEAELDDAFENPAHEHVMYPGDNEAGGIVPFSALLTDVQDTNAITKRFDIHDEEWQKEWLDDAEHVHTLWN